jgi:hypothetical protein
MDRYEATEHDGARPERRANLAWLNDSSAWFAAAVAGMIVVFAGLAVDAYKHNNGAGEEAMLSFSNPGHLIAGIGLAITSVAVLAGLSVAMLKGVESADHAIRRFVPVTGAWVLLAAIAIGSVTYIGSTGVTVGHSHGDETAAVADDDDHEHGDGGDAAVAAALEDEGIDTSGGTDISGAENVRGALTQGASGQNDGAHDHGKQPTFTQLSTLSDDELFPMFPEGTVARSDIPALRDQVQQVRDVALRLDTPEKAVAAGYVNTTSDVPFMGKHYLNTKLVTDGIFDPTQPEGLLFSDIGGEADKLVGVWFLQLPGIGNVTREVEPAGFASDLDLWHAHIGLCLVGTQGASEGETRESCDAKGGRFTADLRWMMHVWVAPEATENPDGIMAYLNSDLYEKQVAAKEGGDQPSGVVPE